MICILTVCLLMKQVVNQEFCRQNELQEINDLLQKQMYGLNEEHVILIPQIQCTKQHQDNHQKRFVKVVEQKIEVQKGDVFMNLFENQLKISILFHKSFDIQSIIKDTCTYTSTLDDSYKVYFKTFKLEFNLRDRIIKKQLEQKTIQTLILFYRIAISLKKLHDKGIIHTNLTSQNIQFLNQYTTVITGLERCVLINQTMYIPFEANSYLHESILKQGSDIVKVDQYDYCFDIYSLGVIFYEIAQNQILMQDQHVTQIDCKNNNRNRACKFATIIQPMLKALCTQTSSIDSIIKNILKNIFQLIQKHNKKYKKILRKEKEYYKKPSINLNSKYYIKQIKYAFKKRRKIFEIFYKNRDKNFEEIYEKYIKKLVEKTVNFQAADQVPENFQTGLPEDKFSQNIFYII